MMKAALKLRDSEPTRLSGFSGTGSILRNRLSEQFRPLTDASDVKSLFPLKGQFNVYSVLTGKYTAHGRRGVEVTGLAN